MNLLIFLRRNGVYIVIFHLFLMYLYFKREFSSNPIPYLNISFYALTYFIIQDSLAKTRFNKEVVVLFMSLFLYLSILFSISKLIKFSEEQIVLEYILSELIIRFLLLTISIYLFIYAHKFIRTSELIKLFYSVSLSLIIILANFNRYILFPNLINTNRGFSLWQNKNYSIMVICIILLLIFWYKYYHKIFVLSEYLNSIIFIFTLINLIEPVHYLAIQWKFDNWFKGQMINLILIILMMIFWYARLVYLNSEESIENERYLMNFQYLNGFVAKPHKNLLSNLFVKSTTSTILLTFLGITVITLLLYITKKLTFFLLLNTFFISIIVLLALFFSINSIKKDWQNQISIFLKDKINK